MPPCSAGAGAAAEQRGAWRAALPMRRATVTAPQKGLQCSHVPERKGNPCFWVEKIKVPFQERLKRKRIFSFREKEKQI